MPFNQAALQLIRDEIDNDPQARGYSGQTTDEITRLINQPLSQSPQVFVDNSVDVQQIALVLIKRGQWESILDASVNAVAPGHADALNLVEVSKLSNISDTINVTELRNTILNLISASVLTNADGQALQDLARTEVLVSRAQVLVGTSVGKESVEAALALP